jgi:hypothetical protein
VTLPQPPDLEAIQARVDAATPGPWTVAWSDDAGYVEVVTSDGRLLIDVRLGDADTRACAPQQAADLAFIAAVRTDVPDLLAEVSRLRTELARAKEDLDECKSHNDATCEANRAAEDAWAEVTRLGEECDALRAQVAEHAAREARVWERIRTWTDDPQTRLEAFALGWERVEAAEGERDTLRALVDGMREVVVLAGRWVDENQAERSEEVEQRVLDVARALRDLLATTGQSAEGDVREPEPARPVQHEGGPVAAVDALPATPDPLPKATGGVVRAGEMYHVGEGSYGGCILPVPVEPARTPIRPAAPGEETDR